jgi:hypothetical protein
MVRAVGIRLVVRILGIRLVVRILGIRTVWDFHEFIQT